MLRNVTTTKPNARHRTATALPRSALSSLALLPACSGCPLAHEPGDVVIANGVRAGRAAGNHAR